MVEGFVEDPTRIAQLLSSELTGLETGPLASVEVVDADRSVDPDSEGPVAYVISFDGERIGTVRLFPDAAVVALSVDAALVSTDPAAGSPALSVGTVDGEVHVRIERGAAVKRAIDVLRETLRNVGHDG